MALEPLDDGVGGMTAPPEDIGVQLKENRLGWAAQLVLFAFLHDTPYQILAATSIAAMLVIVLHELRSRSPSGGCFAPGELLTPTGPVEHAGS
jgi:hypothetical protein